MSGPPEERGRSLASSSGFLLAGRIAASAGYFVSILVLARTLGPDGRGALAFLTIASLVISAVMMLGLSSANTVYVPQRQAARPRLLTNTVLFVTGSSLLGGTIVFGALIVFDGLGPGSATDGMYALCIPATVFIGLSEAGLAFLIANNRAVSFSLALAISAWLNAIFLLVLMPFHGVNVHTAVLTWVVASGLGAGIAIGAAHRKVGFGPTDLRLLRESLRFGFRAWLGSLAGFLNFRFDQILMAYLATEAALGFYSIAVNMSEILLMVPTTVGMLMTPMVARTAAADRSAAVLGAFRVTLIVTIVSAAVAALLGPAAIPVIFGAAFDASVVPFLLLLPGALGFVMMRLFSSALVGSSHPGRSSIAPIVALITSVVFDLLLIPSFGAGGAAAAATLGLLVAGIAAAGLYRQTSSCSLRDLIPRWADARDILHSAHGFGRRLTSSRAGGPPSA